LRGDWDGVEAANSFLGHLQGRGFSPATVRAYAFDLLCFARFCVRQQVGLMAVAAGDIFHWVDEQMRPPSRPGDKVVRMAGRGSAPASVNRRIAAVRSFFEHLVIRGIRESNPVPVPRRSSGLRPKARGVLGHLGPSRRRDGGRLVRQPSRLPESVEPEDVAAFLADLGTHRDRAMVLLMVLGGLRCAEVRNLRLADVDQGRRRVRIVGKGNRERVVPVERAFFSELAAYLRNERPAGLATAECFVVLRGPTSGSALTEAGVRSLFRRHRVTSGSPRVRPHRLRHTFGTELAAAGMDLVVLRDLMGHASPETTAKYVHLSDERLAAEYAAARAVIGR
jgi:integrase/recombinase XerC